MSSVNKTVLFHSDGIKPCIRCGKQFSRPVKYSGPQWEARKHCSRSCAATKRRMPDNEIVSIYLAGHSSEEIAKTAGVSPTQILRVLRKHTDIRSASENKKLSHSRMETKLRLSAAAKGRRCPDHVKDALRQNIGSKNANWRNGLTLSGGYLMFTASSANGEHAGKHLHSVIAEWKVKRPIRKNEAVHHIDGDKLNNNPENLRVMTKSDHARLHALESGLGKRRATA